MNKISGKVLHQESRLGISNLVVVVYDFDPESSGTLEEAFGAPTNTTTNPGQQAAAFWNLFPGDRLGSVISDGMGGFELEFEDDAFRLRNQQEIRPDLFLMVLSPDNALNNASPLDQIVYRTTVPIFNAGQMESVVIHIPTSILEARGVPIPQAGVNGSVIEVNSLTAAYERAMNRSTDLTGGIRAVQTRLIQEQAPQNLDRTLRARRFAANLKKVSATLRDDALFVSTASGLRGAKNRQLERAVARQQSYGRGAQAQMNIDLGQIADFFPNLEPDIIERLRNGESMSLDVELGHLCKFLRQHSNTTELIRTRSVWDAIVQRYKAQETVDEVMQSPPTEGGGEPPVEPESLGDEIRRMIFNQLKSVQGEEAVLPISEEEDLARLERKVNSFKLNSGPADTTAYHDFHTLQIAFEHVWKEAFDENLKDKVAMLYEQVVKVREDSGLEGEIAYRDLRTMEDYTRFLQDMSADLSSLNGEVIPEEVKEILPELRVSQWNLLNPSQQVQILTLAERWKENKEAYGRTMFRALGLNPLMPNYGELKDAILDERIQSEEEMNRIKGEIQVIVDHPDSGLTRVQEMLKELGEMISEPYAFDLFHPNTVNFGLLATYRQKREPKNYQVGSLVSTIPLAPGESRKYTQKMVVKRNRSEKEIQKTLISNTSQSTYTNRALSEITEKASTATNFQQSAEGSIQFGIGSMSSQTSFGLNQQQESATAKKSFREAVVKASQEYKNERHIEVNTSSGEEMDTTTSGEIKNTNSEITTTYLFYELERQYRISEHLHKMTPVIMVAQDVPAPHEIDEDWLLAHEWILRRVLLDDMFNEAFDYISDGIAGDEISLHTKKRLMLDQRELVKNLETQFDERLATRDTLMEALRTTSASEEMAKSRKKKRKIGRIAKAIFTGGASLVVPSPSEFMASGTDASAEVLTANREAIERRLELLEGEIPTTKEEMNKAISALERVTKEFTDASSLSFRKRTQVDQLRIHVKQNILYYMQAIWDHEPPDQRFFRLYNVEATIPAPLGWNAEEDAASTVTIEASPRPVDEVLPFLNPALFGISLVLPFINFDLQQKKLHEIADLDSPLGYKGNYMIFPLRECVYLTDFMMQEYVDGYLGLRDPDDALGEFPDKEGLIRFAENIYDKLSDNEQVAMRRILLQRLTSERKDDELIVVPTGQLFIEALPGTHPLLEEFKQKHRRLDVEKVRAEVLRSGLENLRYLERLEADMLEDPDTEKKLIIREGNTDLDISIEE